MAKNRENAVIKVDVTFRHTEPTEALKTYASEKITHCIEKYVQGETEAHVILSVEKRDHMAEVTLRSKLYDIVGKASTSDLYAAIDKVCDTVVAQLRKQKDRITDHKHANLNIP